IEHSRIVRPESDRARARWPDRLWGRRRGDGGPVSVIGIALERRLNRVRDLLTERAAALPGRQIDRAAGEKLCHAKRLVHLHLGLQVERIDEEKSERTG